MSDMFEGASCIVTGGTSGIGFGIAEALLRRGASVLAVGVPEAGVQAASEKLAGYPNAQCKLVDVTDWDSVKGMVDEVVAGRGRLAVMFDTAGGGAPVQDEQVDLEYWKWVLDINLWGVIYGTHAALPVMCDQGGGAIVNTASVGGLLPAPYQALYVASKAAVAGLTQCLRYEFAHKGVRLNTICPGNVATPIFGDAEPPDDAISVDEAVRIILDGVERNQSLIIFPEKWERCYHEWISHPEQMEAEGFRMADERRAAYERGGRYY